MDNIITIVLTAVLSACVALAVYILIRKRMLKGKAEEIIEQAKVKAEALKKEKIFQAREKFMQLKTEHEKFVNAKNGQLKEMENGIRQKERVLSQQNCELQGKAKEMENRAREFDTRNRELDSRMKELETAKRNVQLRQEQLDKKSKEYDALTEKVNRQIEEISGMSATEAKNLLMENMMAEARLQAQAYINDTIDEARLNATKEAKRIVINTIQRTATETAIENAVTSFPIESDEIKGRIIGREGRNIRALEAATGVEIVVDDTPDAILLSAFDPVRREVARLALHQLVIDGRIHPARIEEVVAKVKKQLEEEILETGKRTCIDLGIHGMNMELVKLIGRMKYRSSYGQNLLQHSREVANICATMASELGLNPKAAKRAGLLHDIGKVSEEEPELPHALLGMKLAEAYKEKPEICNAIGAHHEETEMTSILAPIVMVGDAISGARPGARREVIEAYIKRLKGMEDLAASYPGVTKSYAIQAGRELRVIVGAEELSDEQACALSSEIAQKIQNEMTYPGQVKITVIRETRSVAYAK